MRWNVPGALTFDLPQTRTQLRQDDLVARRLQRVAAGGAILDQAETRDMQLPDFVHGFTANRRCLEFEHRAHPRQHGGIDAVGLAPVTRRLREPARASGVHLDQRVASHIQRSLHVAVIASGRLVDGADGHLADSAPQGRKPRLVVAEPGVPAVGLTVDVERVFGNVDADAILHCLSSPVLVVRGNACRIPHLSVQDMRKAGAIEVLTGPWEPPSFRPVPRRSPASVRCRRAAPVSHRSRDRS